MSRPGEHHQIVVRLKAGQLRETIRALQTQLAQDVGIARGAGAPVAQRTALARFEAALQDLQRKA